jgi:hypothetical protein
MVGPKIREAPTSPSAAGRGVVTVVEEHFRSLVADCPPNTILVAQVVLVEGATHVVVAANREVTAGGPSPNVLRNKLAEVVRDHAKLCPRIEWVEPTGELPS